MSNRQLPSWVRAAREKWEYRGQKRPAFAHEPGPGQESVWDFPRPPSLRNGQRIEVRSGKLILAETDRGFAICETAHPPSYYVPREAVNMDYLEQIPGSSFCEWKGEASYFDVLAGTRLRQAAWSYETPFAEFAPVAGAIAFRADSLECFVDGERARPQPGGYYAGWVTSKFSGPFKGEPGVGG